MKKLFVFFSLILFLQSVNAQNIGIGTTSPAQILHIRKSGSDNYLKIEAGGVNANYSGIMLSEDGLNYGWSLRHDAGSDNLTIDIQDNDLNFTSLATFKRNGNLGIGISNPAAQLHLSNDLTLDGNEANSGNIFSGAIRFGNSSGEGIASRRNSGEGQYGLSFYTGYANRMLIANNGYVGIGTTAPTELLDVNGKIKTLNLQVANGAVNGYILKSDANGNASWVSPTTDVVIAGTGLSYSGNTLNSVWTSAGSNIYNNNSGNVGIGTSNPTQLMQMSRGSNDNYLKIEAGGTSAYYSGILLTEQSFNYGWSLRQDAGTDDLTIDMQDDGLTFTNVATFKRTGKIGIGLSNPAAQLHLSNDLIIDEGANNTGDLSAGALRFGGSSGEGIASNRSIVGNQNGLDLFTGSQNRMSITNDGNIGIGTQFPTSRFHIKLGSEKLLKLESTSATGTWLEIENTSAGGANYSIISTGAGNGEGAGKLLINTPGSQLAINSSGNLGIGITSPVAKLHVKYGSANSSTSTPALILDNPNGGSQTSLQFRIDGTETGRIRSDLAGNVVYSSMASGSHYFRKNDTDDWMVIEGNTGNVGIGTTSPSEKLDVSGRTKTANFQMTNGATNGYVLQSDANGNASWVSASSSVVVAGAGLSYNGNILNSVWEIAGTNIYSGNGAGHVGVGTSTPGSKMEVVSADGNSLTVSSTNTDATSFYIKNSTIGSSRIKWTGPDNSEGPQKLLFINPGNDVTMTLDQFQNRVGIGTTSPAAKLDVNGTIRTTNLQMTNGASNGYILQSDGAGNASWVAPSSLSTSVWTASGNDIYKNNSGNVGIGTSSPSSLLHVSGSSNTTIISEGTSGGAYVQIKSPAGSEAATKLQTDANLRWLYGKSTGSESGSNAGSDFFVNRYDDAGTYQGQPFLIKRSTGNIGVGGIGTPVQKLDVAGNINVSSTNGYYIANSRVLSVNGSDNIMVGVSAAGSISSGTSNVAVGKIAAEDLTTGSENTAVGYGSLNDLVSGNHNVAVGFGAGLLNNSSNNTFLGHSAGAINTGSGSVMIGYQAGSAETASNKLYIDNNSTANPLVYGDFSKDSVAINGNFSVEGAMSLKVKASQAAGTNNPNATASIWIYSSGTGTIDLTSAAYTDRMLVILNNTGATRNISSYQNLSNSATTTLANNASLWLVYDGTTWRQIK